MLMRRAALAGALAASMAASAHAEPSQPAAPVDDQAALFGAREAMSATALSPDGKQILYLAAGRGAQTLLMTADANGGAAPRIVLATDGKPMALDRCDWADNSRIVCYVSYYSDQDAVLAGYEGLVALDSDGRNIKSLAKQPTKDQLRISQYAGGVVDWMQGATGKILVQRDYVPESTIGTRLASSEDGLGVDLLDTRDGRSSRVELPVADADAYLSDGKGVIRIRALHGIDHAGYLNGTERYEYRTVGSRAWLPFSTAEKDGPGLVPIAIDPAANVAYCSGTKDGRQAMFRVSLDGSMKTEVVLAGAGFDAGDVARLGRQARVLGVSEVDDRERIVYVDKSFESLANALSKAIPKLPLINFVSSSADEQRLLIYAGSDDDPGRYYVFDRTAHRLNELALVRPNLEHVTLARQTPITFPATDGTAIPAYLTLPPGSSGKGLPAIVMPHGGPSSRDEWGFDYLVQFFAARGYAVLQPEYRGSSGYGDAWAMKNGFQSWRTAIADVTAAGHWLVSQGIAAPEKLAIVGWSYGGYAALQSNIVEPDLFKAVVAVAPVTDFGELKSESEAFTDKNLVKVQVGSGDDIIAAGSPARHASVFKAPVLMFHGTADQNVAVAESRLMNDRLHAAGKQSTLVIYPNLDHQLPDGDVRADMLRKADAFLRQSMHIPG